MATAIIRPTAHIDHSSSTYLINNTQNMYDNNESTFAQGKNAASGYCILTNFDASALSSALTNGGKITSITLCMKALGSNIDPKVWACHDASSTTSYTDCGDGSFAVDIDGTYLTERTVSFSNAVSYWNKNINAFLGGGFQIRITSVNYNVKVYEVYVRIEYDSPTITYTYVNYDGTVLKEETVEQGTEPTPPSDPTRPSTAQYEYTFSGWSLSGTTYTAQYTATKRSYTISTAVTPEGAGTVTGGGSGKYGTTKTLTATANDGYVFAGWSDGDTTNPRTVTIKKKATYTAQFEEVQTSKIRFGADKAKAMFDEQKSKARSVWYGTERIL